MLPGVTLKDVTREDVDRINWWLEDEEVASRWFGHYACGDPVHRGYVPEHMLEAPEWEWVNIFSNPQRIIYSIYDSGDEHVGECQVLLDGRGGAELSVLIGKKALWHHGYGTSAVIALLDRVFNSLSLERAWVNVPEFNEPAQGLFRKLGFVHGATKEMCRRRDGSVLQASIMSMDVRAYRARERKDSKGLWLPIVTITGLPGSGAREIGAYIAGRLGSRFIDEEMKQELCKRLRCSNGELEAFEVSFHSLLGRILRTLVVPMHWTQADEPNFAWLATSSKMDQYEPFDHVNKRQYVQALNALVRKYAAEGNAVLHGRGSHLFVPPNSRGVNVFVSASTEHRARAVAEKEGWSLDEASRWLKSADKESVGVFRHLFGLDLLNAGLYDLSINPERISVEVGAQAVAGALGTSPVKQQEVFQEAI